jgi:plasmid maintenance system antidote protein VapI
MTQRKRKPSPKNPISHGLRDAIRDQGLTAYRAAKLAGVSVDAVQRFMKEERSLTLSTADKIASSLELKLCEQDARKDSG